MIINLKALVVVLVMAMGVFFLAKPICLRFMEENDFARRRNVWIVLTVIAFTSPSFWLFVLVAIPLLAWSARKDTNPVALYVLVLHVISPNVSLPIPVVGINQLFEVNNYRILAFAILIPTAWRLLQSTDRTGLKLTSVDVLILAYGVLQLLLFIPYETLTNTMRRGFLFSIDVLVLYFVVSRTCTTRPAIVEVMVSFCLACAIAAPLAVFESLYAWSLYYEIDGVWGVPPSWTYMFFRAGTLRSQVSTGNAIVLGYLMAIAFGFWLYLRSRVDSVRLTIAVGIWMWMGLLAAYSRAPWIGAAAIFFMYLALDHRGLGRFFKALLIAVPLAGLVLVSPIGDRVIDNLPFVGTVDSDTVTYRQRLADKSWELIKRNPFFGDPFFMSNLEEMRQGSGIIDLVNTYAAITLAYGLVGLSLFLLPFLVGMWNVYQLVKRAAGRKVDIAVLGLNAYRLVRRSADPDPDFALLGANLIACMLATLLILATASFILGTAIMYWVLAGLAAGYAHFGWQKYAAPAWSPGGSRNPAG